MATKKKIKLFWETYLSEEEGFVQNSNIGVSTRNENTRMFRWQSEFFRHYRFSNVDDEATI